MLLLSAIFSCRTSKTHKELPFGEQANGRYGETSKGFPWYVWEYPTPFGGYPNSSWNNWVLYDTLKPMPRNSLDDSLATAFYLITQLYHEIDGFQKLLQFNTTQGNYYIHKVDSLEARIKTLESQPIFKQWQGPGFPGMFTPIDSAHMYLYNTPIKVIWR